MAKQKNGKPVSTAGKKRQRMDADLSALYAVPNSVAYDKNGKLRSGVYGMVRTDLPIVSKPGKDGKPSTFVRDFSDLPKACKNRVIAFREDSQNGKKAKCYLADKRLYDEMRENQATDKPQPTKAKTQKPPIGF